MDLEVAGRRALVCGASRGLGFACARSLAREGAAVTIVARRPDVLAEAADMLRTATGAAVEAISADITTAAGRRSALGACPNPDILVTNAGGPPPGDFRNWEREDWIRAVDANMLTPIELIKATIDGMMDRGFGRIVNITSGAVKAPIAALGLSNGARAGLTGFIAGIARETVRRNVTINNLLPGPFETDRLEVTLRGMAERTGRSLEDAREERRRTNPSGRFGDPEEFGDLCAFLCSMQAGYITGQNLLIDGGAYPGTF